LENNSWQTVNLTKNGQSDSTNKSKLTLSHGVDEEVIVVNEDDDE
jgi:hypothetical protein